MKRLSDHRVLLVNDDGIHAPGIQLLETLIAPHCEDLWVVAPSEEKSGASHSVSMHIPIRVRKLADKRYAVNGTPTDCVLMALQELMDEKPTLILSGINRGANLGDDAHYSGTIAVAIEGTLLGIPSIALSQVFTRGIDVYWETAKKFTVPIIQNILEQGMPEQTFVNVNFPPVPVADVSGIQVVNQGRRPPGAFKTAGRVDCREVPYYWVHLSPDHGEPALGSDLHAIEEGAVAVSPLKLDMTDMDYKEKLIKSMKIST